MVKKWLALVAIAGVGGLMGCAKPSGSEADAGGAPMTAPAPTPEPAASDLAGEVRIDGSSTVGPVSEAVAEEFMKANPGVSVAVTTSGTGGGFKKFCVGETDINDASRPIKQEEADKAGEGGIEFIELPVAYDGLSVVVHPENDFVDYLTVDELKKIWEPESKVSNWNQVRESFPDLPLKLYGPDTDSGTFDYFTEAVCGEEKASRSDYSPSADDNTLVEGVSGDKGSLGYFGFAYYEQNQDKLKLVPIKSGDGEPVAPSTETINDGSYEPLSRPLFIYVSKASAERPEVKAFIEFYLQNVKTILEHVGYVPLPDKAYELAGARFAALKPGSIFTGGSQVGVKIEDLLAKE